MPLRFPALLFALISAATAQDWPSFRGPAASGVADNQNLPVKWDAARGTLVQWSTALPGLAHSSPIVWQDRIFVTTAVSSRPDASFKRGLYGEGDASGDVGPQQWKLICLDRRTGKILWDRTAYRRSQQTRCRMKEVSSSLSHYAYAPVPYSRPHKHPLLGFCKGPDRIRWA
jgi:hypothetical protein